MSGLVKLACPECGCIVFEPETYLKETHQCLACHYSAPIDTWIIAGVASKKRPDFWVGLAGIMARSRRLAAEAAQRSRAFLRTQAGGISF
jgi:hypothetical protein